MTVDPEYGLAPLPDEGVPGPCARPSRHFFVPLLAGLITGSVVLVGLLVRLPYAIFSPGPAHAIFPILSIEGAPTYESEGELYFTTIRINETVNLVTWAWAQLTPNTELVDLDTVRPPGQTDEESHDRNALAMDESILNAQYAALTHVGYTDIPFEGDGARIEEVVPGYPAEGVLEVADLIIEADGVAIAFSEQLGEIVRDRAVGDTVDLRVLRDDEELALTVATAGSAEGTPLVGIATSTENLRFEFPVEIVIDSAGVGGPSAGLMYSVAIVDLLTEGDLTGGHLIAGTGTISPDGSVGQIGGIAEKVVSAIAEGAEYFLAPSGDATRAAAAAGDDLVVLR